MRSPSPVITAGRLAGVIITVTMYNLTAFVHDSIYIITIILMMFINNYMPIIQTSYSSVTIGGADLLH